MSQNFGKVGNKILVKKKTPSVVTVGLGWPAASRELDFGFGSLYQNLVSVTHYIGYLAGKGYRNVKSINW